MHEELERFVEWDTEDHSTVTTTSAAMFAEHMLEKENNAAWLSQAHVICQMLKVKPGHIENRLHDAIGQLHHVLDLLDKALPHVKSSAQAEHLVDGFRPRHRPLDDMVKAIEEVLACDG